jgi:signal transduction histidine kinase/tetratricopeptide (TPR) repeat protein
VRTHGDDRYPCGSRIAAQPARRFVAIDARQPQVHQDDVRLLVSRDGEASQPVGGFQHLVIVLEVLHDDVPVVDCVIDHQDARFRKSDAHGGTDVPTECHRSAHPDRIFAGRFRPVRLLKQGLGIETLLGTDLADSSDVIIKIALPGEVSPGAQHRLEHEAAVLREVQSPWLPGLLQFGRDPAGTFLVTPFVRGATLESVLRCGPLPVDDTLAIARCLLLALEAAHDRGVLHRDLKPSNVIVGEQRPVRSATLIDFGLARTSRLQTSIRDQPVGTLRYMSPEQAGLLRHDVGPPSDLYAAGVVLFECLAGRPPFAGADASAVLRQHLTAVPPELRALGACVPRAVDELVKRLLRKDPRDRYQSARAVLADVEAIAAAVSRGVADPQLVLGLHDVRRTISDPAFVGRSAELGAFARALEEARAGRGGLVVVEAESGGGKSRLLDEVAAETSLRGGWVLRGQTFDEVGRRPLDVLAGVVAEIVASARADPALSEAVRRQIGESAPAAMTALPELSGVLGERPAISLGPEAHGEARTLSALIALVDALGSPARPAAILLDDCQWADELTLNLLAERQRRTRESHTVIAVAFRSEEVAADSLLRTATPAVRLPLSPLDAPELRRLLESMAGPLPDDAIVAIGQLSAGSPFLAQAALEGLVEMGALRAGPDGWTVEPQLLADAHSSRRAAVMLARRIERLPTATRRLVAAGAVLGRRFDLDEASALCGDTPAAALEAAADARQRRLVWASGDGTKFTFLHDKIREALLAQLAVEERRALHRRAAARLESEAAARPFDLAYHYDAGGEPARAFPHALRAAAQARAQHALQAAELHYRIAWRGADAADRETRRAIAEALGDVLLLRGAHDDAAQYLEAARDLATTDLMRAQAEAKIGELVFRRGDVLGSVPIFERALEMIGRRPPKNGLALLLMIVRELFVQVLHTWLPRLFVGRRSLSGADRDLLEVRIYGRLAYCNHIARGALWTCGEHLRQVNVAERYPPTPELAQAYSTHGVLSQICGLHRRAIAYGTRSLELRTAEGDIWGQGQSLHFLGISNFGAAKFQESIRFCNEAIRVLQRTGDRWEENTARHHVAMSHYYLGELAQAADEARRNYSLSNEIGDFTVAASSLKPWALATGGDLPEELTTTEAKRPDQAAQTVAMLAIAEAVGLLRHGRAGEALAALESGRRYVWERRVLSFHVSDLFAWIATARRLVAEKATAAQDAARRALLRRAERAARAAVFVGRIWRSDLPHALREAGLIAGLAGRQRRARRLLQRSMAEAERLGARYDRAQSLLACGRIGLLYGWPGAAEQVRTAIGELRALGATLALGEPLAAASPEPTLATSDRFDSLLQAGRKLASALTHEAILEAVREASATVLRAQRCALVEIDNDGSLTPAHSADAAFSHAVVERALAAKRPVALCEGAPADVGDSAILAGVRSALCTPIFVRGHPRLCLYATHAQVGGLFSEADERLAGFIAALAGAALENAEGFAEVQMLTRTLENRVGERTAQLSEVNRELAAKQAELERQNDDVRRANERKSAFLASMSHELRTPLNAILGFTRLALKKSGDALPEVQRQNLKKVEKSAVDLVGIVNDVLDLAKIEAGKLSVRADPFAVADLLDEVLASAASIVGDRPLRLEKRYGSAPPHMLTDRVRLRQIVLNLVSNAIRFTPAGSIAVEVEHDTGRDLVRIAVVDTGVGIAEADRARVFEPFDQADNAPARASGGTGLGLSIVRRLCELLGGNVALDSTVGSGSRFTVELPRELPSR